MQEQQGQGSTPPTDLWVIKNRPYTQNMNGVEVTYSILNKKQQTFVLTHPRFLYLNGIESISYASASPPQTALPLKDITALPKFKTTFPLTKIKTISNIKEKLTIQFSEGNTKWEFECPSEKCAIQWKDKVNSTLTALKEMIDGKFASYADYIKYKKQHQPNNNVPIQGNGPVQPANQNTGINPNPNVQPQINNPQNVNNVHNSPPKNNQPSTSPTKPANTNNSSPQKMLHPPAFNSQLQKTNGPTIAVFNGPVLYPDVFRIPGEVPKIPQSSGLDKLIRELEGLRRNWVEEWLHGEGEEELIINFKTYVQKAAQILIMELPNNKDKKFPAHEFTKQFATFILKDVHVEIFFLTEDNLYNKHERYQNTLKEFKNMDHLANSTRNLGPVRVPLMVMFEYKGILGMAKTRVAQNVQFRNRELYQILDHRLFQQQTKISTEVFLNESKCKIVLYEGKLPFQTNLPNQRVYFVDRLMEFLPSEAEDLSSNHTGVLRPEFVHDQDLVYLQNVIFRDRRNPVRVEVILKELESKVQYFVQVIEQEDEYFTNSKELVELLHFYGLNMRHLGLVLRYSTKSWLKRIIRSQIVSRCLKNYLRLQLQHCLMQNNNPRQAESKQRRTVINLLNVVFGNTESTSRLWNNLNSFSRKYFNAPVWSNDFSDFNIQYLLQALQSNLNIVLHENIFSRQLFKSSQSFQENDFVGFEFSGRIYDLDFTQTFELINEALLDHSSQSFHDLCELMMTYNKRNVQMIKILEMHPIHLRIYEYLLNFTSPQQSIDLYNKAQASYRPNRFLYQAKLAEIKWYLKADRQDNITQAVNFFTEHVKRWLGDVHPLLTQVYRHLAEYFCDIKFYYDKAIYAANASLSMQLALFQGDNSCVWRDYFLVGKIHFVNNNSQQGLKYLIKAKQLAKVNDENDYLVYGELCLILAKSYKGAKYYKQAYTCIKQFFQIIKNQTDEQSLGFILEAADMIKTLLEMNQQHESFFKFIETDFSHVIALLINNPRYLTYAIKICTIPYLKNVLLQKSKNRAALHQIIDQISRINQQPQSGYYYLTSKISNGKFPKEYLYLLHDMDSIIEEITHNEILSKWISYNKVAGLKLLNMIGDAPINRSFEFLSYLAALFNFLGGDIIGELTIIQK